MSHSQSQQLDNPIAACSDTVHKTVERVMPAWDVIPYEDVIFGPRLGKGAFGAVYKGRYLGLDIALKEVEASTKYEVEKYFEREWRIMRECRHPNIVQFLGLCQSPEEGGPVYIVSEYVPMGTLRSFILGKRDFPWRMRISFATDISRALAYLHARECLHRDLKGENLLVTSNDRIKMTDFGFARITAAETDAKNMTYCGTDWYMSPEMMNGEPFGLPTDVFTLGIVFAEISARRVVDLRTFQVRDDSHTLDPDEVYRLASPGCPPDFLDLALECCAADPSARPKMTEVLNRLRIIELDILSGANELEAEHVGSVRLVKPSGEGRGMPDFEPPRHDEDDDAVGRMEEQAMEALSRIRIDGSGASEMSDMTEGSDIVTYRTARWAELRNDSDFTDSSELSFGHTNRLLREHTPLSQMFDTPLSPPSSQSSDWPQFTVQNASVMHSAEPPNPNLMANPSSGNASVITIRPPASTETGQRDGEVKKPNIFAGTGSAARPAPNKEARKSSDEAKATDKPGAREMEPVKAKSEMSSTRYPPQREQEENDEMGSLPDRVLGTHRFTVVTRAPEAASKKLSGITSTFLLSFWSKPQDSSPKCAVCTKKIGVRPSLQCDDCGTIVHATCSHSTPRDCHLGEQVTHAL